MKLVETLERRCERVANIGLKSFSHNILSPELSKEPELMEEIIEYMRSNGLQVSYSFSPKGMSLIIYWYGDRSSKSK